MASRFPATVALAALLVACLGESSPPTGNGVPESTTTSPTVADPTEESIPVPEENDPCVSGDQPFSQDGPMEVVGELGSDSDLLAGITWQVHPSCDQIEIAFSTPERAPAVDPPEVTPSYLRASGVVRLVLDGSISGSAVADHVIETALAERAYVARSADQRVLVDMHLRAPAFVRVTTRSAPARVVVDLIPGGPEFSVSPVTGDDTVVVGVSNLELGYPLTVSGYVMNGEQRLEATIEGNGTRSIIDVGLSPPDHLWRAFEVVFPNGPAGPTRITIGDSDPLELTVP